jgi:hypothetical protein
MIECDNIAEFARCLAKFPPGTRHLEEKMLMARNRQSISESLNLVDVHYNLGNDLYEYVYLLLKNCFFTVIASFAATTTSLCRISIFSQLTPLHTCTSFPETCLVKL